MEDKDGQLLFTLATKNEILFLNKEEEVLFARLNAVGILVGSSNTLYYFGSVV